MSTAVVLPYPEPVPVELAAGEVCVAVLDLSARCNDPGAVCSAVVPATRGVLEVARQLRIPIAYTVSGSEKGEGTAAVAAGLAAAAGEPVFRPDDYDKLADDGLLDFVRASGASTLIICGSSTNVCVLYTATSAVRRHGIDVVIPVDCVNAKTEYQQGYALYQLTSLPSAGKRKSITLTHSSLMGFV